jgi:hypothetical protein
MIKSQPKFFHWEFFNSSRAFKVAFSSWGRAIFQRVFGLRLCTPREILLIPLVLYICSFSAVRLSGLASRLISTFSESVKFMRISFKISAISSASIKLGVPPPK